jgi:hypothetical protein
LLEAPPEPSPEAIAKRRVLRVAWAVVAGGAVVAFGAAVVGGAAPGTGVAIGRQAAGVIMLAGLAAVLITHRMAWLRGLGRRLGASTQRSELEEKRAMLRFLLLGLPATMGLIIATWAALAFIPKPLAGVMIFAITVLLSAVLLVVAVHGKGYLAAFCMGALIPILAEMVSLVLLPIAASMNRYSSNSRTIEAVTQAIEVLGDAVAYTGLVWLAAFVSGIVAMGTWALVGTRRAPEDES